MKSTKFLTTISQSPLHCDHHPSYATRIKERGIIEQAIKQRDLHFINFLFKGFRKLTRKGGRKNNRTTYCASDEILYNNALTHEHMNILLLKQSHNTYHNQHF